MHPKKSPGPWRAEHWRRLLFAPIAPRRARKPNDAAETIGTSAPAGDRTTISKGMAAPTENAAADVSAACTGRAVVISEIPSSSRAWAVKASFAISCWATCRASVLFDTTLDVDFGQLIEFEFGVLAQLLALAREIRPFGVGLRADGHILAGGHRHGAGHQSRDTRDQDGVLRRGRRGNANDQTCGRDDAIVGPSTAARSHPMRPTRWRSGCRRRRLIRYSAFDQIRPSNIRTTTMIKIVPRRPTPP